MPASPSTTIGRAHLWLTSSLLLLGTTCELYPLAAESLADDGAGAAAVDGGHAAGNGSGGGGRPAGGNGGSEGPNCDEARSADSYFAAECTTCHGSAEHDNPAPPPDTARRTTTSDPGVGAHQRMLRASSWHGRIRCGECHPVPHDHEFDPCAPNHHDGKVNFEWGPVAVGGLYDATTQTCSYTWCHGTVLAPDQLGETSVRQPEWTLVDGSQSACGKACHTLPPGGTHDSSTDCASCHPRVIAQFDPLRPEATVWVDPDLHINGWRDNL